MPLGYTVVLEPVDAKPSKAFIVDDSRSQFKCHYCQKFFRKESLLVAHMKHNHRDGKRPVPTPKPVRHQAIGEY